ncbi:MAG: ice-binding family protein [Saprospiraceae bacterium]
MKLKLQTILIAITLLLIQNLIFGQAPNLGVTSDFALFTAVGAFNNVGASTVVTGDVGTNSGAFNAFPPGTLIGQKHVVDVVSAQAATDVMVAYMFMTGITCGTVIGTTLGNGQVLLPDVYCLGAASTLNADLILDGGGDPNALFIFKIEGALSTNTNSNIILTNGASLCNVYWRINGAVSLGVNSVFRGTIIAQGAIELLQSASLFGRALSTAGAISLQENIVNVAKLPLAATITASGPTSICEGDNVTLSGNNGGTWSNGETSPSIIVTSAGDYFVTNTTSCGSVTSNHIIVSINPLPTAITGSNASICSGIGIAIGSTPIAGHTYSWTPATGLSSATISNPIANPSITTTYTLTETITATGCKKSNSVTITVNNYPSCLVTGNGTLCNGQSIQLCAPAGTGYSYNWSNLGTTQCISVNSAGTFSVTVTKSGCSSICSKNVIVNPAPTCNITGSSTICQGSSTSLCAPSGYSNYLWSNGAKTNCITVNTAGTYSVIVTNSYGCKSVCSKSVIEIPPCTGSISGDVWFDTNMNGIYDVQEKGINGYKVYIIDAMTGAIVATVTTKMKPGAASYDGYFIVNNLAPGMYYVKFEKVYPLVASAPYKGGNPNKDSDITHENGVNTTKKYTVLGGSVISFVGAGFHIAAPLSDKQKEYYNANAILNINDYFFQDNLEEALQAFIYPNPVSDQLNVELWIPQDSKLEVNIFDLYGKAVLSAPFNVYKTKGKYNELLETTSLTGGQYILQIKTNSGLINKNFSVSR